MILEDQICTLEQAKRLKEFGISQETIYFMNSKGEPFEAWIIEGTEDRFWSAFTVAELGVMLPAKINNCRLVQWPIESSRTGKTISYGMQYRFKYDDPLTYDVFPGNCIFGDTEAIARAKLLIALLEGKTITPEECNERLTSK